MASAYRGVSPSAERNVVRTLAALSHRGYSTPWLPVTLGTKSFIVACKGYGHIVDVHLSVGVFSPPL